MHSKLKYIILIGYGCTLASIFLYFRINQTLFAYITQKITRQTSTLCKNCNVILISLDTLSAQHLPCYGYKRSTSPNLCSFAKNNIWFPNSYAQSYFTLPSHFSIFTSLYPSTHGVLQGRVDSLAPIHQTLTEVLHNKGYTTLYFGPTDSLFFPLNKGLGRGFDYIDQNYTYAPEDPTLQSWKRGINMLKNNQKNSKPTFLFLHTYYVHQPYLPMTRKLHFTKDNIPDIPVTNTEYLSFPPDFISFVKDSFTTEPLDTPVSSNVYALYNRFLSSTDEIESKKLFDELTEIDCPDFCVMSDYYYGRDLHNSRKIAYMNDLYDETILNLDTQLKDIFSLLDPLLKQNTILIVTSDHGEEFMEHNTIGHSDLYSEVIRVPLIMSIPRMLSRKVDVPVEGIDLYPTILRLLGIPLTSIIEGADLTENILGLPFAHGKPYIISDMFTMTSSSNQKKKELRQETIIDKKWKLYAIDVAHLTDPDPKWLELYDVQKDPQDIHNVASRYPEIVKTMRVQLKEYLRNHQIVFPKKSGNSDTTIQEEVQQQRYIHY